MTNRSLTILARIQRKRQNFLRQLWDLFRGRSEVVSQRHKPRSMTLESMEERRVLATMFAVDNSNNLLTFDSATPGTISSSVAIGGLGSSEFVSGIDVRPATGQLYAFGIVDDGATRTGRIYTLNTSTGAATAVGNAFSTNLADTDEWGFDFNPVVDRIRITSSLGSNLRVHPNSGTLVATDTSLTIPYVSGIAYDRIRGGVSVTTLYGYDYVNDQLVTIGGIDGNPSPNGGNVTSIGSSGITAFGSFDMDIESGTGIARLSADPAGPNGYSLFTLNLQTGAATLVGTIGDGSIPIRGLTTVSSTLAVVGTAGIDTLLVTATDANSGSYSLNGSPAVPFTGVTGFSFLGGTGDDTLTINNPAGGLFSPISGIDYNGGGQTGDTLQLMGGGGVGFNETYFVGTTTPPIGAGPGNNGNGLLRFTGPTPVEIRFTGLAPIVDTVTVARLTVNSTDDGNTITIDNGTAPRLKVTVDAFELIEFNNKTTLTINAGDGVVGGDGADTINLNFTNTPAALTSVTINADESDDTINVLRTAVLTNVDAGGGDDLIKFANGATLSDGQVVGGIGNDTVDYSDYVAPISVNLGANAPGLSALAEGAQENPAQSTAATGTVALTYNNVAKTFNIDAHVSNLSPALVVGFHIHRAQVGTNGPVIIDLAAIFGLGSLVPNSLGGFDFNATNVALPIQHEAALLGGFTYFNVHTATAPGGLIRGQIFANGAFVAAPGTATGTSGLTGIENAIGGSDTDSLVGDAGINVLRGGLGNDAIIGAKGNDTLDGGDNNDQISWSNGDNNDIIDGGLGIDTVQVNGSITAGDTFTIGASGTRVAFSRTNLVPFNLDIGTAESFVVAGAGGDDNVTVSNLAGVADLTAVGVFGLDGNDALSVTAFPAAGMTITANGGTHTTGDSLTVTASGIPIADSGTQLTKTGAGVINYTQIENLTFTNIGDVVINGTGANDTLVVNATGADSGSYSLNGGQVISFTGMTKLTFNSAAGNDALTINNPAGSIFAPLGGIDYNGGGQSGDTLNLLGGGGTGIDETYFVGTTTPPIGAALGNNGDGLVRFTGTQAVDIRFTGLSPIMDTVVAASLTVNATDLSNTISIDNGAVAPRVRVSVNAFEPIEFDNKTAVIVNGGDGVLGGDAGDNIIIDFSNVPAAITSLIINADEGSDTIELRNRAGNFPIAINGGIDDFHHGDAVTIFGTAAADNVNITPNTPSSATVSGLSGLVNVAATEHLVYDNLLGGNDTLTVTATAANDTIIMTPGLTGDSGNLAVNSLLPVDFKNLGSGGALALADQGGTDRLVYNGGQGNDNFSVNSSGVIGYQSDTTSLVGGTTHIPLNLPTAGNLVEAALLNGFDGDDNFIVSPSALFTSGLAIVAGNPSGSDRVTLNGTAAAEVINLTLNSANDSVTGIVGGTIILNAVEDLTFSTGTGDDALTVTNLGGVSDLKLVTYFSGNDVNDTFFVIGTSGNDSFNVAPTSANEISVSANGVGPVVKAQLNSANTSAFTVNGANGSDQVKVIGTALAESFSVTGTQVAVGSLKVVNYSNFDAVAVLGLEGNDTFTVTPGVASIFIDGGDPIGVLPGDMIIVNGGVGFFAGPENDEGGVLTPGGTVSFDHIESISVAAIAGCPFLILGTDGDDDITVIARDASTTTGADGVQDFTFSINQGTRIVVLNQADLFIDAMAGDDDIVIRTAAPNEAAWDVNVRVAGGSPSIGAPIEADRLVLETPNGTNGFDDVVFNPTGNDSGNLLIDKNANGTYDAAGTDSLITLGGFVFLCPPAGVTYTSTAGGVELIQYNGEGATGIDDNLTINGTALDDTTVINPTGIGTGSFSSGASPQFIFQSIDNLAVNPGSSGFDRIEINGTAGPDTLTSNANTVTLGGAVTIGAGIDQVDINTFDGNDSVTLSLTVANLKKVINLGAGNDAANLSAVAVDPADPVIFGGDGDDNIVGSPNPDLIFGGSGNDTISGLASIDTIYGDSGNDTIIGGTGDDQLFGGDGSDRFTWNNGDNTDNVEGDEGVDVQIVNGAAAGDVFLLRTATNNPSRAFFERTNLIPFSISMGKVEQIDLNTLAGTDQITIRDLSTTDVRHVNIDVGAQADLETVTIEGRTVSDSLSLTALSSGVVNIAGLAYDVNVSNLYSTADSDTLTINALEGNDSVTASDGLEAIFGSTLAGANHLTINGGAGDDRLIGYGQMNGDVGNDTLLGGAFDQTLNGGNGDDRIEGGAGDDNLLGGAGEDTFIGGAGNDTIDGGADFDTIIVNGTTGNDAIDINQTSATTIVQTVNSDAQIDTLVLNGTTRTVERVSVSAGAGDDTIRLNWLDVLGTDADVNSLRFDIDAGLGNTSDRLGVVDNGTGDLILYQRGTTSDSGNITVGPGNAEPLVANFINVEYTQPIAAAGGDVVVFKHDPFEFNNTRLIATYLGAGDAINVDPNINPGTEPIFGLPGDEDWYRLVAERTGVLDFQVTFRQVGPVTSGRPGLPNSGNLDIQVTDLAGNVVANFGANDNTDNERVRIPAVAGQTYYLRVFANGAAINTYNVTVDNYEPPTPFDIELLDNPVGDPLPANSDTGRSQFDNITRDSTPILVFRLSDAIFLNDLPGNDAAGSPPDEVIPIPFQVAAGSAGYRVAIFDEGNSPAPGTQIGTAPQIPIGFATLVSPGVYQFTTPVLTDGSHFLDARVQMIDPATPRQTGFGPRSQSLEIVVDTIVPSGFFGQINLADKTQGLAAASDTGVVGQIATFADRVSSNTRPEFYGRSEANSVVRLYVETNGVAGLQSSGAGADLFLGLTTTEPVDGSNQFPGGQWKYTSTLDLNNPALGFTQDGLRTIYMTNEDVAGNVTGDGSADVLNVFLDTAGPQVTNVQITGSPAYNLFGLKPGNALQGPTPAVNSLTVSLRDLPNRSNVDANFLYEAIVASIASTPGNIIVKGDHNGIIQITSITVVNDARNIGSPAAASIRLNFNEPLPDDRFTLTILDSLVDPVGNNLDGESNASEPNASPTFPSGDGQPKSSFSARFTVDSRPEVGTVSQGLVYVDINGNFVFDPEGQDNDATNRDFVYQFGTVTDGHFSGNFANHNTGVASGYDKLGVYGFFNGAYSFSLDTDDDGVADFSSVMPAAYQVNGIAVAGNFSAAHSGDEIGLFDGQFWYLDANGNNRIDLGERFASNANGLPIVGDFNGDGSDDLALFNNDTNTFTFDTNRNGAVDFTWVVADDINRFVGLRGFTDKPVAGDLNLDGIDDIGLWVKSREGANSEAKGEFYFWVSDRVTENPANVFNAYSPSPLGNDLFTQYGSSDALPVFGNFDPPVAPIGGTVGGSLTNSLMNADVNRDGAVSPIDALIVINALRRNGVVTVGNQAVRILATNGGFYWDVSGDGSVSPIDVLQVINYLNRRNATGEGEGTSFVVDHAFAEFAAPNVDQIDSAFANLDWSPNQRKVRR